MLAKVTNHFSKQFFSWMHSNYLVYNSCWEDPRLDHEALQIGPEDKILVITSAGCNVLDYALSSPKKIYAVDVNPKQGALLELKISGIRNLDYDTFFEIFGKGKCSNFKEIYPKKLRKDLSPKAREFWDKNLSYFGGQSRFDGFYFRGTSGTFAQWLNHYIDFNKIREPLHQMFQVKSLKEQKEIYDSTVSKGFWSASLKWILNKDLSMALLGVPRTQRKQVEDSYQGGMGQFIYDCLETVFTKLPLHDNYFWWLYINGEYSMDRCPRYLQKKYFEELKTKVDAIQVRTQTIEGFLKFHQEKISRFVLLDHMDWFETHEPKSLVSEWNQILRHSNSDTKIIWRSARLNGKFVNDLVVSPKRKKIKLEELLQYKDGLAESLHRKDRVHTYGSFNIATVRH